MKKLEKIIDIIGNEYSQDGKNVLQVKIYDSLGEVLSFDDHRVELSLSTEAKIGLGVELIKSGLDERNTTLELNPCYDNLISEYMGVFLHPQSCSLQIRDNDFGVIDDLV